MASGRWRITWDEHQHGRLIYPFRNRIDSSSYRLLLGFRIYLLVSNCSFLTCSSERLDNYADQKSEVHAGWSDRKSFEPFGTTRPSPGWVAIERRCRTNRHQQEHCIPISESPGRRRLSLP